MAGNDRKVAVPEDPTQAYANGLKDGLGLDGLRVLARAQYVPLTTRVENLGLPPIAVGIALCEGARTLRDLLGLMATSRSRIVPDAVRAFADALAKQGYVFE